VVEGEFVFYPEENEGGTGDPDGQADNIERGIGPVLPEIAQIRFKKISEHGRWLF
jgi:hypothetical protein